MGFRVGDKGLAPTGTARRLRELLIRIDVKLEGAVTAAAHGPDNAVDSVTAGLELPEEGSDVAVFSPRPPLPSVIDRHSRRSRSCLPNTQISGEAPF
jgi:hypothetical protein